MVCFVSYGMYEWGKCRGRNICGAGSALAIALSGSGTGMEKKPPETNAFQPGGERKERPYRVK